MRLKDWKTQEELVLWAAKLFGTPQWELLMEMMEDEHPKNYPDVDGRMDPNRELGKIYGYDLFINNLTSAAEKSEQDKPIEATFERENYAENAGSRDTEDRPRRRAGRSRTGRGGIQGDDRKVKGKP